MKIRITPPERINATIQLPSSKSISNRALIISALGNGEHQLENLSDCDDTQVMIRALHAQPGETIDILAAGTAMRFLTAYLSVTQPLYTTVTRGRLGEGLSPFISHPICG